MPLIPSSSGGGGSGSWLDSSAARLRGFSSPITNAFLSPVFNACAVSPMSVGSPDVDPFILRYTHCRLPFSASNSPDPHSMAQKPLHWLLYVCSPLSFLSSSSPLSRIENLPSVLMMSPMLYKTLMKVEVEDIMVMDGMLVSESDSSWLRLLVSECRSTRSSFSSFFRLVMAVAIISTRWRYAGCGRSQGSVVIVQSVRSVLSLSLTRSAPLPFSIDRSPSEGEKKKRPNGVDASELGSDGLPHPRFRQV